MGCLLPLLVAPFASRALQGRKARVLGSTTRRVPTLKRLSLVRLSSLSGSDPANHAARLSTKSRRSSFPKVDPGSSATVRHRLLQAGVEARGAVPSPTRLLCRTRRRELVCYAMRVDLLPRTTTSWTPWSSWGAFKSSRARWNTLCC
ncbi:hypothetical protein MUK42_34105 [Musa troglodytarum]|uniref:Uncharacterized protein n=1 Tax=Musa troglodytarum TaxID=320322 RepID=A0A9E7GP07_9LILI|nr:hypothetical protein MUK42_34105 [Musa troglodytarum]